jgi:acyl carrier protein phosphodiesterase
MNFLAHLYLSGTDPDIMTGNFIGDFVKGRPHYQHMPEKVVAGIELHRIIDAFTDSHPVVANSKKRLWPKYRHYAGVIIDIYYDHFLAKNWGDYHQDLLPDYADACYQVLQSRTYALPEPVNFLLPHMIRGNWLVNYAKLEGIHRALSGMARRTTFVSKMEESVKDLEESYEAFKTEFQLFFPDLINEAKKFREENNV